MTIKLIRDEMLLDRYIIFRDYMDGVERNIFLIDTEQNDKHYGGLYLWSIDDSAITSCYDLYDGRLKIIGVDDV